MPATGIEAKPRSTLGSLASQVRSLAVILLEEFGEPFAFYDTATGTAIDVAGLESHLPLPASLLPEQIAQTATGGRAQVTQLANGQYQLALPLCLKDASPLVGMAVLSGFARTPAETVRERDRLQKWAQSLCDRLMMTNAAPIQHRKSLDQEGSATLAWEAVAAVEQLMRRVRFHKETEKNQSRILRAAAELLRVKAVVWVPQHAEAQVIAWGDRSLSPWDCRQLAHRMAKSPELGKSGFLLVNDVQEGSWGACFPQVINFLALAIREPGTEGLLIAINKHLARPATLSHGPAQPQVGPEAQGSAEPVRLPPVAAPFRRSDIVAFTPFAALFGLHCGASARYHNLKELMVGLARSLTSAIDAKDTYTFGHSERVGRFAVELGRAMGLGDDETSDLYLAGLLHDIGKIGIPDAVLCKRDALTAEEWTNLQQHVTIGHAILSDLHPIRHLLPGVLYHHERMDGTGYPEGLKGDAIPSLARILAVADGYDAMSSTRPYRTAMPRARVEEILRQGAGTQWDPQVVEAFFRCRDKIYTVRQRGIGESLRHAINGAMRQNESSQLKDIITSRSGEPSC